MSQIKNKFIEAASGSTLSGVTDDKMRLRNNQPLRARNAANTADVNVIAVSASDVITMQGLLSMNSNRITNVTDPSGAQDASTKNYVDTQITANAGANKALSNLVSVAINTTLLPASDNTIDLGSSAKGYANGYINVSNSATIKIYDNNPLSAGNNIGTLAGAPGGSSPSGASLSNYVAGSSSVSKGWIFYSANASSGTSSPINLETGNNSGGASADISLIAGTASTTRGTIHVKPELRIDGTTSGYVGIKSTAAPTSYTVILPGAQGAASTFLQNDGSGNLSWATAGSGSVTSVALADSTNLFNITGSPVTTSGTLTLSSFKSQTANTVLAAPNGSSGAPTFRVLVAADIPTISLTTGVSGILPIANGGTGANSTSQNFAFIGPTSGSGAPSFRALVSGDIPSLSAIYLPLAGGTMSGAINMGTTNKITNLADPTAAQDAATKNYVDTIASGISWKNPVLVASTSNITLSGEQTIDGVTTSASRVLVQNQTTAANNGIYVSAAGAWARSSDASTGTSLISAAVFVEEGTVNANTAWVQTTQPPITIGTTAISFVKFASSTPYTFRNGLTQTGQNVDVTPGDNSLTSALNSLIVKEDPAGAIVTGASGIKVQVNAATQKINGSNAIEGLKPNSENLTLSSGDITAQFKDLSFAIYGTSASANSAILSVVGGPIQQKTVDYTVSLTGGSGGVTRITFAGDLATGGAAALVSGDILMVSYSYLT